MADSEVEVRAVDDLEQILEIVGRLFLGRPCVVRDAAGDIHVSAKEIREGLMVLVAGSGFPPSIRASADLIVTHVHEGHLFQVKTSIARLEGNRTALVTPHRLILHRPVRKEKRYYVRDAEGYVVKLHNCVSIDDLEEGLREPHRERDALVGHYTNQLRAGFGSCRVVWRSHIRPDPRLMALVEHGGALWCPDVEAPTAEELPPSFLPASAFAPLLNRHERPHGTVAEVAFPLRAAGTFVFGYLQVFAERRLDRAEVERIGAVAAQLEEQFEAKRWLPRNPSACPVSDVSRTGLGFVHPLAAYCTNRLQVRSRVLFRLSYREETVSLTGRIQNRQTMERGYRIGLSLDSSPDGELFMHELVSAFAQEPGTG